MKTVEENRVGLTDCQTPYTLLGQGPLTNIHQQRQPFVLGLHLRGVRGDLAVLSSYLTGCPSSQTAVWPMQESFLPSHSPDLRSHLLTSIKSIIFKWSLPFREHRHTVTSLLSTSLTELFFRGLTCHFLAGTYLSSCFPSV